MTKSRSGSPAPLRPRLLLIATAVLFSTGGAVIKGTTLNGWQVGGLRSVIAATAILILIPDARRNWTLRQAPVALAYGSTVLLYVTATKLTTAANAIFLQESAPLWVFFTAPLLLKERIRRSDIVLIGAVAAGMALFFTGSEPARATAPDPRLGNMLALASGLTWALTITGLRWIARDATPGSFAGMSTIALGNLAAAIVAAVFAFPIVHFTLRDAAAVTWLGLFQISLAYVLLTRGIRSVPVFEATTLLLLEPALNPLWTWLVHGERPSAHALAGGGIIVLATGLNAWWQNRSLTSDPGARS
ncbi:MAG TPA: DMT family transporter [Bryobacteraceae bacterium]|nr:DMT family transporter [Bryobacteraceae bacterium]